MNAIRRDEDLAKYPLLIYVISGTGEGYRKKSSTMGDPDGHQVRWLNGAFKATEAVACS